MDNDNQNILKRYLIKENVNTDRHNEAGANAPCIRAYIETIKQRYPQEEQVANQWLSKIKEAVERFDSSKEDIDEFEESSNSLRQLLECE